MRTPIRNTEQGKKNISRQQVQPIAGAVQDAAERFAAKKARNRSTAQCFASWTAGTQARLMHEATTKSERGTGFGKRMSSNGPGGFNNTLRSIYSGRCCVQARWLARRRKAFVGGGGDTTIVNVQSFCWGGMQGFSMPHKLHFAQQHRVPDKHAADFPASTIYASRKPSRNRLIDSGLWNDAGA